jgi:hypothetical protein
MGKRTESVQELGKKMDADDEISGEPSKVMKQWKTEEVTYNDGWT